MFIRSKRFLLSVALGVVASFGSATALAVPAFQVQDLGLGVPIDTNSRGLILGADDYTANRPWVYNGQTRTYLPMPLGVTPATASRLGETGAVAGQLGTQAAVWWPSSAGAYELELVPSPVGATGGKAVDVNAGGTVLLSYSFPVTLVSGWTVYSTRPYLYSRGGTLVDLGSRYPGLSPNADAMDLSDNGRVLLMSGQILEPDGQVTATPAFPEPAPGGYHWTFLRATRLNEAGSFIGVATLSSSMGYAQVVRHTPGAGWKVLGGLSANVGASGIDRAGNTLLFANYICPINYGLAYATAAGGTYCLDDLIVGGGWSFLSYSSKGVLAAGSVDASDPATGTVVALGYNVASGSYRMARLTRVGDLAPPPAVALSATAHPASWQQPYDSITLTWTSAGQAAKAYSIERRAPGGSFTEIARVSASYAQYDDTTVVPLASYTYRMAAIGLAGTGPYSNEATAQAPAAMDRSAPLATINSPADGATVTGVTAISATFTDDVGVSYASFSFSPNMGNGTICTGAPATPAKSLTLNCNWDTRKVAYQSPTATLVAYAQDAIGNWVQKEITVKVTYGKTGGKPRR